MKGRTVTIHRYCETTEVETPIELGYTFSKGHKGCLWGDYPEPPEPDSCDVWPIDDGVTLTDDERSEGEAAALEDHSDRRDW